MKRILRKVFGLALVLTLTVACAPWGKTEVSRAQEPTAIVKTKAGDSSDEANPLRNTREPIMGGYFRNWHDEAATKDKEGHPGEEESLGGLNSIGKVPAEVDLLLVFDDFVKADGKFWQVLKDSYVPKLNQQGTQVVRTIPWRFLACVENGGYAYDHKTEYQDAEGNYDYQKIAEDIVNEYVYKHDLDGLDVDIELTSDPRRQKGGDQASYERSIKVFEEIGKIIGPQGRDKSKLFIVDSTYMADQNPMMTAGFAKYVDFVLAQTYGRAGVEGTYENALKKYVETREERWQSYRQYIDSRQYLIGFSFYEERAPKGNRWYDVPKADQQLTETRAADYAKWQPETGGVKGGIFSYALDRDGIIHPSEADAERFNPDSPATWHESDKAAVTTYKDTIELKKMMEDSGSYNRITSEDFPDAALREEVINQIGDFKGNLISYDQGLELSNPEIKDLTGLEKMKHLKSLKLSNMTGLEKIKLNGLKLETLDFEGVENWKNVKYIDLSENRLDLTANSPDAQTLKVLYDIAKRNGAAQEDIILDRQKPVPYPNPYLTKNPLNLPIDESKVYDIKAEHLHGTKTIRDTKYEELKDAQFEGISFIADDYDILSKLWDYSDYTGVITDHAQNITAGLTIKQDKKATYKVQIFDKDKKLFREFIINVGEGERFLDNLAFGAKILKTSFRDKDVIARTKTIFNNKIDERYEEQLVAEGDSGWFAFDIGTGTVAESWEFYNNTAKSDGGISGFNAKSIKVEILKNQNPSEEELNDPTYLKRDENWEEVGNFTDGGDLKVLRKNLSEKLTARYWRVKITEKNGSGWGTAISALEFKILGERDYKIALRDLIDSTVMVETVGMDETSVKNYEAAKAEAEQVLATDFENETALKEAMAKLQQAINDIKEAMPTVDRSVLRETIKRASEIDLSTKTAASKQAFNEALGRAELLVDADEVKEEELTQATADLEQAMAALEDEKKLDTQKLQSLLDEAAKVDVSKTTAQAKEALEAAVVTAQLLMENPDASQADITAAEETLGAAIEEAKKPAPKMNEWVKEGNDYYYYDGNGQLLRSAMTPDGYRVNADGKWVKGKWKQDKNGWWYEYEDGYYLSNTWKKIGRFWYHFKSGGYMSASRWVGSKAEGYYYVNKDGQMLTSTVTPDGYTVDKNGKWDMSIPQIKR